MTTHFKKPDGSIYGFEDYQLNLVTPSMVQLTSGELGALLNPPPTTADIIAGFTSAIQQRLDAFAQTRNYDGILSACSYIASGVAKFAAEAAYCVAQRDSTWAAGYVILADVQSGNRSLPTVEQVMAELPALEWPQ